MSGMSVAYEWIVENSVWWRTINILACCDTLMLCRRSIMDDAFIWEHIEGTWIACCFSSVGPFSV